MAAIRARHDAVRERRLVLPTALLILLVALTATRLGAQAREWAGCYDLESGPWSRAMGADSLSYAPPPRVRLDTLIADGWSSDSRRYQVRPAPGSPPSSHEYAAWRPTSADAVVIDWSTRYDGVSVRLTRDGSLLLGRARTHTHVLPFEPHTADVVARPVDCDAPMPPEHASWRRFPREVPLETGDTLAVGEPLPRDDLRLEYEFGSLYWVRHRPTGLFSGANDVIVARDEEGIVRNIEVYFDPKMSLDTLESRLASRIGPPTARRDGTSIFWIGRERHALNLRRFTTSSGEERLVIVISGW